MKIIFKILDYLISVFMGSGTVVIVYLVVGEGWNMFIAMIAGMVMSTGETDFARLLWAAILFSIFTQFCIDLYNMKLRGEVPID